MIDLVIKNNRITIKKFFHRNDQEFQCELDTLILMLIQLNAYEQPRAYDLRMLNDLYLTKEGITHIENALKTKTGTLYTGIKENKNNIINMNRRVRNENKNNKK
ncbi:MAG: hypothetical protein MJ245_07815 [Clostridia bacterium]|nr:hypothetical protein [Clostridia bacterium]